jgi:hypothetical protein
MIKPKYTNNVQPNEYSDNAFTQKKEEKQVSNISLNAPIPQQMIIKSNISNM